jgi:hypothetical protein
MIGEYSVQLTSLESIDSNTIGFCFSVLFNNIDSYLSTYTLYNYRALGYFRFKVFGHAYHQTCSYILIWTLEKL